MLPYSFMIIHILIWNSCYPLSFGTAMKKLIIVLLAIFSHTLQAQRKDYLDENGSITSELDAVYYRTQDSTANGLIRVRDYYTSNNQLAMEGTFTQVYPTKKGEGKCSYYHENGQLKEQGEYKNAKRSGLWHEYYANGQIAEEVTHLEEETLYHQHWDETGNALLVNGTGKFITIHKGESYHKETLDSLLIAHFRVDESSGDSIYYWSQEKAEYKGGNQVLYGSIGRQLVYPVKARRQGIEGKVFIEFKVDKLGRLKDARILKGIGGGCDEEALKVFNTMNDWIPAKVKGKPVIMMMVLPLAFKLGD